jgi:hypothetical protein
LPLDPQTGQVSFDGTKWVINRSKRIFDEVLIFSILINSKFFRIIQTYLLSLFPGFVLDRYERGLKMTAYEQATIIRALTLRRTCVRLLRV